MKKLIVYTDGGSRGNPGPSAIGIVLANEEDEIIKKYSFYLGEKITNNQAEYEAVIFALKKIKALFGKEKIKEMEIELRSDSELLIKQLRGAYKILDDNIGKLFLKAWNLRIDFKKIEFRLIPREKNREADRLANEALNKEGSSQRLL